MKSLSLINNYFGQLAHVGVQKIALASVGACLLFGSTASADVVIDSGLTGTVVYDGWVGLSNSHYLVATHGAGYPGTAPWSESMMANESGSNGGELMKTSGGGYAAGGSIYSGPAATYEVFNDSNVVANLASIVFSINSAGIEAPTLSVNGGTGIVATSLWDLGTQTVDIGGTSSSFNTSAYQWDLSSFGSAITSFDVLINNPGHNPLVQMQLEQSDTYSQISPVVASAVPEPSSAFALLMLGTACVARRRRSQ